MLAVLAALATFLMLPPSAFLWNHLPKLRYLQFPWRWLGALAVTFAFFITASTAAKRRPLWLATVIALMFGSAITVAAMMESDVTATAPTVVVLSGGNIEWEGLSATMG